MSSVQLGQITMDNASNNNSMLESMAKELKKRKIPFDADGNRIRLYILEAYAAVLKNDPVGHCRDIVAACRVSGQRRRRLRAVIKEGNESGFWRGKLPDGTATLPVVQLLRDCVTRWSSTFKMTDRVILLNPAIQSFLQERQNADIAHLNLDAKTMAVLQDIQQVIEIPHTAQELLSSERTPTLSMALPAYEQLAVKWKELQSTIWELAHYIGVGLEKLEKYRNEGRKTRIYAFAMILNPGSKFEWIKTYCTRVDN
ncbi:ribonuclease H-like domain-containing protein [Boletus edulis BED1]|uniref:Ribonuclease H-like domain-containing protein n=1 Tax=Boletus edulis BED1 TaxID=1328754 RepID=A0AAD4BBW4_BOLED|nr:ribonuclease H-like domain-containing protein [Boletus edulis BED1]KAF8439773.1 ribonuclease H-like domain-containing protein [Boletus edulis BED1]